MISGKVVLPSESELRFDQLYVEFPARSKATIESNGQFKIAIRKDGNTTLKVYAPQNDDGKLSVFLSTKVLINQNKVEISPQSTVLDKINNLIHFDALVDSVDHDKAIQLANNIALPLTKYLDKKLSMNPYYFENVIDYSNTEDKEFNLLFNEIQKDVKVSIEQSIANGTLKYNPQLKDSPVIKDLLNRYN